MVRVPTRLVERFTPEARRLGVAVGTVIARHLDPRLDAQAPATVIVVDEVAPTITEPVLVDPARIARKGGVAGRGKAPTRPPRPRSTSGGNPSSSRPVEEGPPPAGPAPGGRARCTCAKPVLSRLVSNICTTCRLPR